MKSFNRTGFKLLSARLTTSIGNGIHLIVLSKFLYDETGSVYAFGAVLLLDSIIGLLFEFISGGLADRFNVKKIAIITDILVGVGVIISGLFIDSELALYALAFSVLVVNIGKPFYRNAIFALVPLAIQERKLISYYNSVGACIQVGAMIGAMLAGPLIMYGDIEAAFYFNGLTFLISAAFLRGLVLHKEVNTGQSSERFRLSSLVADWVDLFKLLFKNIMIIKIIFLSSFSVIVVRFVNLAIVPIVAIKFSNDVIMISFFEAAFAAGAIMVAFLFRDYVLKKEHFIGGYFAKGCLFLGIAIFDSALCIGACIFFLGLLNVLTGSNALSALQLTIDDSIRAKISSLNSLVVAMMSFLLIPLVSYFYSKNVNLGVAASGGIVLVYVLFLLANNLKTSK